MDYKKTNAPLTTTIHDLVDMAQQTGNIYETVCIISKRANQIAAEMKSDLEKKLQEFASMNDNLEEISENREQIEISRYYEKLPKPTLRNITTTSWLSAIWLRRRTTSTSKGYGGKCRAAWGIRPTPLSGKKRRQPRLSFTAEIEPLLFTHFIVTQVCR